MGEVYQAIRTGKVRALSPVEKARALAVLALRAKVLSEQTKQMQKCLLEVSRVLRYAGVLGSPLYYLTSCYSTGTLERVWGWFCREALISAQSGFAEVKASVRFLPMQAQVRPTVACRLLNLWCALGVLRKIPSDRGNRFVVSPIDPGEVKRRWEALG